MSKNRTIFLIGAISFLIPFLGFPVSWEHFFFIIFGLILMGLSFSVTLRKRMAYHPEPRREEKEPIPNSQSFSEEQNEITEDQS